MEPTPRVRLVDVARAAGVSKTTVSDALNGAGRLPPATRDHVRREARRLGYRPNATARGLRAGRTRLLGLAAREYVDKPWMYTELAYFAQLVTAATQAAQARGYGIVLLPTSGRDDYWLDMPLDGVFIVDPVEEDPMVGDFLAAGVPVVADRRAVAPAGRTGLWVDFDYGSALREVLDHLARVGAERVAVLSANTTACFYEQSAVAYREWCAERGHEPLLLCTEGPGPVPTLKGVDRILGDPARPDALITLVEVSPPLLIDAISRSGRRVPDDLLLVCATEDPTAPYTVPPTSTLSFRPSETAMVAIDLLIDRIEGGGPSEGRIFEAAFHSRASSQRPGDR